MDGIKMLYNQHECKIQNRLTSIRKKKVPFQMQGNAFCVPGRPHRTEMWSHLCSMNSPRTREWSVLGLKEIRKIWEQIILGGSFIVLSG